MSDTEQTPDHVGRPDKTSAKELLGEQSEQIILLVSRYGTWDQVYQYEPLPNTRDLTQSLINRGYLGCSEDGKKLWITEKARQELSF